MAFSGRGSRDFSGVMVDQCAKLRKDFRALIDHYTTSFSNPREIGSVRRLGDHDPLRGLKVREASMPHPPTRSLMAKRLPKDEKERKERIEKDRSEKQRIEIEEAVRKIEQLEPNSRERYIKDKFNLDPSELEYMKKLRRLGHSHTEIAAEMPFLDLKDVKKLVP